MDFYSIRQGLRHSILHTPRMQPNLPSSSSSKGSKFHHQVGHNTSAQMEGSSSTGPLLNVYCSVTCTKGHQMRPQWMYERESKQIIITPHIYCFV